MKFELYQGKDKGKQNCRWRAHGEKGLLGRSDEAFLKANTMKAVEAVRAASAFKRLQMYVDKQGKFRWRLLAANGKVVAISTKGWDKKTQARKAGQDFCLRAITAKKVWAKVDKKKKTK